MNNKYIVAFLFLFIASIAGGLALKNIVEYSMVIGVGLAIILLLASAFSYGKRNRKNSSHN